MAITKRKVVDQITIEPEIGTTTWRETTIIEEDGVELSRTHHRSSVMAGDAHPAIPAVVLPHRVLVDTPENRAKVITTRADFVKQISRK